MLLIHAQIYTAFSLATREVRQEMIESIKYSLNDNFRSYYWRF